MNYKQKRTLIGRVLYIALTLMAVTVLAVTMYTFFGSSREPGPDSDLPLTTPSVTTQTPSETEKPTNLPAETDDLPVVNRPSESETTAPNVDPPKKDWTTWKVAMPIKNGEIAKKHDLVNAVFSVTMNDYRVHCGLDIGSELGAEVLACADGTVTSVGKDPFMGMTVVIDHGDGLIATYRNLGDVLADGIAVGTAVSEGQVIGTVGESAIIEIADEPHLHLEMTLNGSPIDPLTVLRISEE